MRVLTLILAALIFYNCNTSKKPFKSQNVVLEKNPSFELGQVYFQKWIAGVQGGGSGIKLYIPVLNNKNQVIFDSVYFRNTLVKIIPWEMGCQANFNTAFNQKKELVMHENSINEYGNALPNTPNKWPINIDDFECVIQYTEEAHTKYYQVKNIQEKQVEYYPSSPQNED